MSKKRYGQGKRRRALDEEFASHLHRRARGELRVDRSLQDRNSLLAVTEVLAPFKEADREFARVPGRLALNLVSRSEVNKLAQLSPVSRQVSAGRLANRLSDLSAEMFKKPVQAKLVEVVRFGGKLAIRLDYPEFADERSYILGVMSGIMSVSSSQTYEFRPNPYIEVAESPTLGGAEPSAQGLEVPLILEPAKIRLVT